MARAPITRSNPYTPQSGAVAGITFTSERQYRNALARAKGYRSWGAQQQAMRKIRSGQDVGRLRPSERQARAKALDALSRMRHENLSLTQAAKATGTTVAAIKRHAGTALEQTARGAYRAKPSDRLVRPMMVPTVHGPIPLDIRDSRAASLLGRYWSAVRYYLETGDAGPLRKLHGKGVTVAKRFYPLITDPNALDTLADGGELSFDDIYELSQAA
jgi:hypothetical protein